jgi:excisionase family DNA binding protein
MAARVLTDDDLEPLRRELAELRALVSGRPGLLTTEEAAEVVDVTPKTIRAWVADGRLRVEKRRGRRLFFREEDVRAARSAGSDTPAGAVIATLRTRSA